MNKSFLDVSERELKEIIENKIVENYKEKEYYDWNHWLNAWITTKNWLTIIDKRIKWKQYTWFVLNIIEDCVNTMKNLTKWIASENIKTNNDNINWFFKYINIDKKISSIITKLLINWKVYCQLVKDNSWKLNLDVINTNNIISYEENWELKEVWIILKKWADTYLKVYTKWGIYTFKNNKLIKDVENNQTWLIPFIKFELEWGSYVKKLIDWQDMLNIKITKWFDIDKYNADPLIIIKSNINSDKIWAIEVWSWSIIALPETSNLERILWAWINKEFLDQIETYKNDIYKIWKLSWLKNSDFLSWQISWYALKLTLTDTFSFVNEIRNTLKYWFYDLFILLQDFMNISNLDELEIYFPEIIEANYSELLDNAQKLKLLNFSDEYIAKYVWLSEQEIKEELSKRTIEEALTWNFWQLNEQLLL